MILLPLHHHVSNWGSFSCRRGLTFDISVWWVIPASWPKQNEARPEQVDGPHSPVFKLWVCILGQPLTRFGNTCCARMCLLLIVCLVLQIHFCATGLNDGWQLGFWNKLKIKITIVLMKGFTPDTNLLPTSVWPLCIRGRAAAKQSPDRHALREAYHWEPVCRHHPDLVSPFVSLPDFDVLIICFVFIGCSSFHHPLTDRVLD